MTFVKTTCGVRVQVNAVHEVLYGDDETVTLRLDSGITHVASKVDWERAERNGSWQVVAAVPGTYVLGYHVDEKEELSVTRQPVVAWALSGDGSTYPATYDGVDQNIHRPIAVRFPDGSVGDWNGLYDNEEHWLADMRHDVEVHLAQMKAAGSIAH